MRRSFSYQLTGEPLKPLGRVASGGELSRIMLGIKTIMAENDHIESLIFDEIDSGISGRTAQMVSEKMNELGRNHQIICITHLPQIAAMADAHFLIEKAVENKSTVSRIRRLTDNDSVAELARMLGGAKITDTVAPSHRLKPARGLPPACVRHIHARCACRSLRFFPARADPPA